MKKILLSFFLFALHSIVLAGPCVPSLTGANLGTYTGAMPKVSFNITITCTGATGNNIFVRNETVAAGTPPIYYYDTAGAVVASNVSTTKFTTLLASVAPGASTGNNIVGYVAFSQAPPITFSGIQAVTATFSLNYTANGTQYRENFTFTTYYNVVANCNINTSTGINFGTYNPLVNSTATGTIAITCSNNSPYTITPNKIIGRTMKSAANPTNTLAYALYTNSGYNLIWGDTSTYGNAISGTGNGSLQSYTIYGRILSGIYTSVPANDYIDTVIVTLTY